MSLLTGDDIRSTVVAWLFVIGQVALLAAVVLLPPGDDWAVRTPLAEVARGAQILGVVVLLVGAAELGTSLTPLPLPLPHGRLRRRGLYRFVRHPLYSGVDLVALGTAVRSGSVLVASAAVGLVVWFMVKARWEEAHLRERYPDYDDYAAVTPRFVPAWPWGRDRRRRPQNMGSRGV